MRFAPERVVSLQQLQLFFLTYFLLIEFDGVAEGMAVGREYGRAYVPGGV